MMKKLIFLLFLLPFAASAQTVVNVPVKVQGGGGSGVSDGNNYTTDITAAGATITLIRQGLPTVTKALDTTAEGMATLKRARYLIDSLAGTLGNLNALQSHTFSGVTLFSTVSGAADPISAPMDTTITGVTAHSYTDKNLFARTRPYTVNGVYAGIILSSRDGTYEDTIQTYSPSGAPVPNGTVNYPYIRNNIANRLLFTIGRTDTLDAAANLHYTGGNLGIGTTTPAARLHVHTSGATAQHNTFSSLTVLDNLWGVATPGIEIRNNITNSGSVGAGAIIKLHGSTDENPQGAIGLVRESTISSSLKFWTQDTNFSVRPRMTITGRGLVGIGTATPGNKLHIAGGLRVDTLAGTGTRMVVANALGQVSTQVIPTTAEGFQLITASGETISAAATVMNVIYDGPGLGSVAFPISPINGQVLFIRNNTGSTLTIPTIYMGAAATTTSIAPNGSIKLYYQSSPARWYQVQ